MRIMADVNKRRRLAAAAAAGLATTALSVGLALVWSGPAHKPASRQADPALARLEVRVAGVDGKPAAGVALTLQAASEPLTLSTDRSGRALFPARKPGEATLIAALAGAARNGRELTLAGGATRVQVQLEPAATLQGAVVDDTGAALAGVALEARGGAAAGLVFAAQSDVAGSFSFSDLAPGSYTLQARASHHELAVLPSVTAPAAQALHVILQRTSELRGEVLDVEGKPAAGATVTLAGSGVWPPKKLATDPAGHFELNPIPAGIYELRATRGTFTSAPQEGVLVKPASEASVRLQLAPGATLRGRVVDAESGQPLVGVEITIGEDALASVPIAIRSATDGVFDVEGLRHLPHRVWVRAPGYVAIVGEPHLPGPDRQELALRRAATLAGRVVDELGQAVADAELEVTGSTEAGAPIHVSPPPSPGPARAPGLAGIQPPTALPPAGDNLGVTLGAVPPVPLFAPPASAGDSSAPPSAAFVSDATGHFHIEGVPAGRVQLVGRHAGFAAGRSPVRAVRAGQQIDDLSVVISRGGTLLGKLVDGRGFGVAGVRVQIELPGEPSPRVTLSGEDGRFQLDAVRGKCVVTAFPLDQPTVREQIEVATGQRQELVLALAAQSHVLTARVLDRRGFPIEGARVRVEGTGQHSPGVRSASSGADGRVRIQGLPPPPYRIEIEHPAYASARLASVSPEPDQEVSIELHPGVRVVGIVVDAMTNEAVPGAQVRLRGGAPSDGRTAPTNARGRFEFTNVTSGKYDVFVDHQGHLPARSSVLLSDADARELDPIVLRVAGMVSGTVVDRLGAPVLDAEVASGDPPGWSRAARTDRHGSFRITGVEPGDRQLSARHPRAGASAEPVPVRVYARQESPGVVLRLPGEP
jgi:protocatechuate 3,4-dioxygenase beta subunit